MAKARNIDISAEKKRLEEAEKRFKEQRKKLAEHIGEAMMNRFHFESSKDFDQWLDHYQAEKAGY